jgi:hypothetical protein
MRLLRAWNPLASCLLSLILTVAVPFSAAGNGSPAPADAPEGPACYEIFNLGESPLIPAEQTAKDVVDDFVKNLVNRKRYLQNLLTLDPPRIFFSNARSGQRKTYRLMIEFLRQETAADAVLLAERTSPRTIRDFKSGDVLVVNIYSDDLSLFESLPKLRERGVKIYIDAEITSEVHFPVLKWLTFKALTGYPMITSTEVIANQIKSLYPGSQVMLIPHLEKIYFKRKVDEAKSAMKDHSNKKQLLIIHQPGEKEERFFEDLLRRPEISNDKDLYVTVALHPYKSKNHDAFIEMLKAISPRVRFLMPNKVKTNDLFPFVDGAISYSSTLIDVAKSSGLPVYDSQFGSDFTGLEKFVSQLDPSTRREREKTLRHSAEDSLEKWTELLLKRN